MSYLAIVNGTRVEDADCKIARVAKGITNPFETRFRPLIQDIASGKAELERFAAVAGHECKHRGESNLHGSRLTGVVQKSISESKFSIPLIDFLLTERVAQKEEFGKLNDQLGHFRVEIVGVSRGVEGLLARADG